MRTIWLKARENKISQMGISESEDSRMIRKMGFIFTRMQVVENKRKHGLMERKLILNSSDSKI